MAAENETAAGQGRPSGLRTALGVANRKASREESKRGALLIEAAALGRAAGMCRSLMDGLEGAQAAGAERCWFTIRAEAQRLLAQLGRPKVAGEAA